MATLADIQASVDALQTSLDAEQAQIAAALDSLNQVIASLNQQIVDGGTADQRQAVVDKLSAIKTDLESTIPD